MGHQVADAFEVRLPDAQEPSERPSPGLVVRRYVWYLTLSVVSGVGSGILIAGARGRLAMRLLAATADDAARGRVTEAEEVVGRISTGGTINFIVFAALFFGLASGVIYRSLARHAPLAAVLPAASVFVVVAVVGALAVGLSRVEPVVASLRSTCALVVGRWALAAASLVALPGSMSALADIAGRQP